MTYVNTHIWTARLESELGEGRFSPNTRIS